MNYQLPRILAAILIGASAASACDLCAIYTATRAREQQENSFQTGASEWFSYSGSLQQGGHHVDNEFHQHLASSITQLYAAYDLTDQYGVQVNLPYIIRRYQRLADNGIEHGTNSGIGDMSLLAKATPLNYVAGDRFALLQVFGGLKLPTGDSDELSPEMEHEQMGMEEDASSEGNMKHSHAEHSAIHGHDLALGSGSYDFPVGARLLVQQGQLFAAGNLQYMFHTEGAHNYRYADDLMWRAGPGYYAYAEHDSSLAIKANLSGEYKRKDSQGGISQDDTGIRSLFIGPELLLTWGRWTAEAAWDLPLDINNTGLQAVADYRLSAAVSYRY